MKLYRSMLEKLIDLPPGGDTELRALLDDLGLEVKRIETENNQSVFNIETLANRGDHLYALGVAREIAARTLTAIRQPPLAAELGEKRTSIPVRNLTEKCLRYALLEMALPQSMPLRQDIAAVMGAGNPDRHPFVELVNYVLLELGQPMHAFDRDKIDGEIVVELSKQEEEVEALDGKRYKVPAGSILIRDRKKTVAVAGVIGCANSMVTRATTRTLVESAIFDPICVRKTARAMSISTDASYTFERGADREAVLTGLKRLAYLASAAGGVVRDSDSAHVIGYTLVEGEGQQPRPKIEAMLSLFRREMNLPRLDESEVAARLKYLGYGVEVHAGEGKGTDRRLVVSVPSWRVWDVKNPEDLVEDVARSHGMNRVKLALPPLDYEIPEPNGFEAASARIEKPLLGAGFVEVITKGFYSADDVRMLARLDPAVSAKHVAIKNAVESSYSHMKVSNIVHLGRLAESNLRRGVPSCKVFELGRLFESTARQGCVYEHERDVLTLASAGRWYANEFRKSESVEDQLLLFKGVLEGIVRAFGRQAEFVESAVAFLHPGVQATLKVGRQVIGFFGRIHPELRSQLELSSELLYAELEVDALLKILAPRGFQAPADLPSIRRDITLKLPQRMLAAKVAHNVRDMKLEVLEAVEIADDFRRPEEDFRRVTFRLTFRSRERTLEHAEADAQMATVLGELERKHGLTLA